MFKKYPKIEKFGKPLIGLQTGNNHKYIKYWWEVSNKSIGVLFFMYSKGTENTKWYASNYEIINWSESARGFYKNKGSPAGENNYFQKGITYSRSSGSSLKARYLPENYIFDNKSPSIFPDDKLFFYLIGFFNSLLVSKILNFLNPTYDFQAGDLKKIPFKVPDENINYFVSNLSKNNAAVKKHLLQFLINDREFKQTAILWGYDKLNEKKGGKKDD